MPYFITSVFLEENRLPSFRTFGFHNTFEESELAVIENRGGLDECLYNYLVIENIGVGIHPRVENEWWFKWCKTERRWMMCNKPHALRHVINFAFG